MYAGLHPRTLRAYRLALDRFLKYVNKHRLPLRNARSLDKQLAEFIDLSYQEGEPISYAGHLMSAIKRFHPQLRLSLPRSSQLFRNWQRCYVPSRALPASWDLVEGLMGLAFHDGQPTFALLLALGFNCLLRTSEMLSLTHRHVVFHPRRTGLSVVIPGSKTSQGNPQVLLVTDHQLVRLAKTIVQPILQTHCFGPQEPTNFVGRSMDSWCDCSFPRELIPPTACVGVVPPGTSSRHFLWMQRLPVAAGPAAKPPVNTLTKGQPNWPMPLGRLHNGVQWAPGVASC